MTGGEELLYGLHAVRHALERDGGAVTGLWIQAGRKPGPALKRILELCSGRGIRPESVPKADLDNRTGDAVHQGVVLRRRVHGPGRAVDLETLLGFGTKLAGLFLVLDGVQDPHNLGACLRTANAAGADAVLVPRDNAAAVTPAVRKVASGAADDTPVIAVPNLSRALGALQAAGIWVIGMDDGAGDSLFETDLGMPVALVLGAEGRGLRQNTRNHCDRLARLPMNGIVETLNVSVAAGICLYEALRQRRQGHSTRGTT